MSGRQDTKGRPSAVAVNGPALRHIRLLTGVGAAALSRGLGVSRAYITKLELGYNARVSGAFYIRLCEALNIEDRRVLMVNPGVSEAGEAA